MWKRDATPDLQTQLLQKWKNRQQSIQISTYPLSKGRVLLPLKVKAKFQPRSVFPARPVLNTRLSKSRFQRKTDRRIARKLIAVLTPVFDQCYIGWALPPHHPLRYLLRTDDTSWIVVIHPILLFDLVRNVKNFHYRI